MRTRYIAYKLLMVPIIAAVPLTSNTAPTTAYAKGKPTILDATLEEQGQKAAELSTAEMKAFLAMKDSVVLDARPKHEFEIAHIPGSISIDKTGLVRLTQDFPDRSTMIAVYSNGPYSVWAKSRSEELMRLGYFKVSRYQLGLSVWRALGNAAETSMEGFRRLLSASDTVVLDARSRAEYAAGTIPGAVSVLAGEVAKAIDDQRLRYYDAGTRIIVVGNSSREARAVAEEVSRNGYPNGTYFGGTYQELKRAGYFSERKPPSSNLIGLTK